MLINSQSRTRTASLAQALGSVCTNSLRDRCTQFESAVPQRAERYHLKSMMCAELQMISLWTDVWSSHQFLRQSVARLCWLKQEISKPSRCRCAWHQKAFDCTLVWSIRAGNMQSRSLSALHSSSSRRARSCSPLLHGRTSLQAKARMRPLDLQAQHRAVSHSACTAAGQDQAPAPADQSAGGLFRGGGTMHLPHLSAHRAYLPTIVSVCPHCSLLQHFAASIWVNPPPPRAPPRTHHP